MIRRGERRRRYTLAFKRQVVEETLAGGESLSVVARRHDLNANLLFNWRSRYRNGTRRGRAAGGIVADPGHGGASRCGDAEAD